MDYLEAVLPVIKKDVERLKILDKSITKFFADLKLIWTVVPENEVEYFRSVLTTDRYKIISENKLIPEFDIGINQDIPGWNRQQLIKLAIAPHVSSNFYLTLDADVIVVKPVSYSDLVIKGRGIVKRSTKDYHAIWYEWATRVLGLERSGYTHGVTPAIFNKEAMLKLHEYLESRSNWAIKTLCSLAKILKNRLWSSGSKNAVKRYCGWRNFLIRNLPWTEYSLYHTYLEAKKLFDRYHFDGGEFAIYGKSVWQKHEFDDWDPRECFFAEEKIWFTVVQSNTGIPAEYVWEKVKQFL